MNLQEMRKNYTNNQKFGAVGSRVVVILVLLFMVISCSSPELPVEVTYRKAFFDDSLVAKFNNNSSEPIIISVSIKRPTPYQTKIFSYLKIKGRSSEEIGHQEGWAFKPDDEITIQNEEYGDKTLPPVVK